MYIFGRMKILQLCNKVPYPEKDGGAIGINVFTQEFIRAGHTVNMLAMNTSKHYINTDSIPSEFKNSIALETVDIDNSINPVKALIALLKGESYNISRFNSTTYANKLEQLLSRESFDVIQLEGLYLTPYIPLLRKHSKAPLIIREHNVEWKIWERLALEEKNPLKKIYLNILAKQLKTYEEKVINECDGITTTTNNDRELLKANGCKTPIVHIPFGINIDRYIPTECTELSSVFFIGALDWLPNLQGLEWFLKEVWPDVNKAIPDTKLHIAGRNMPEGLKRASYPNTIFYGEVEDAFAFMKKYNIMLAPLLAGSGVRVKIIEGMAQGKAIVTTSIGIEGIECRYGKDVMVADAAEEFAKTIVSCIQNPKIAKQLTINGRHFAENNHDIRKIVENLIGFYNQIMRGK